MRGVVFTAWLVLASGCACSQRAPRPQPPAPVASRHVIEFPEREPPTLTWVRLPAGSFAMGRADVPRAEPVRQVEVFAFDMLKTEVTQGQYAGCTLAECGMPTYQWHPERTPDLPATGIDWFSARAFCGFVKARLCTEAEWEYAARSATRGWTYPWGDGAPDCAANPRAVLETCHCQGACAPCSRPTGNSLQGVCDLVGNVAEWVEDCLGGYAGAPSTSYPARVDACSRELEGA